jgi:hypothetical protein
VLWRRRVAQRKSPALRLGELEEKRPEDDIVTPKDRDQINASRILPL